MMNLTARHRQRALLVGLIIKWSVSVSVNVNFRANVATDTATEIHQFKRRPTRSSIPDSVEGPSISHELAVLPS